VNDGLRWVGGTDEVGHVPDDGGVGLRCQA
jgi:hypothetical protein